MVNSCSSWSDVTYLENYIRVSCYPRYQVAVGLLSPYANKLIKEQTTNADDSINKEATGFVFAKEAGTKIGTFAGKYPKAAEGFVVGSVSTGYDVYNGDATLEKSMMNYVLGFGLAGRSWDQQLSVNAIYKGMVSVNEKDSNEKILFGQGASATEVITGSFAESLLETGGVSGIPRQIISNVISGYIGNKIGELPQDGNKQKVEDKK